MQIFECVIGKIVQARFARTIALPIAYIMCNYSQVTVCYSQRTTTNNEQAASK